MPTLLCNLVIWGLVALVSTTNVHAQSTEPEPDIPAHHHVWGRFAPGAWVRTHAVTIGGEGAAATETITDRTTTLESADDTSFTLKIETQVTVAGKEMERNVVETPPSGYYGENPELKPVVTAIGDEDVQVGAKQIHCRVKQVEIDDPNHGERTVAKVWYAADTPPHIIRQNVFTRRLSADGKVGEELSRREVEVKMLDVAFASPDGISREGAYVFQTLTSPTGKLAIWQLTSEVVPGGVVWQITRTHGADNHLLRETRLTLVDYRLEPSGAEVAAPGAQSATDSSSKTNPAGRRPLLRRLRSDESSSWNPQDAQQPTGPWLLPRHGLALLGRFDRMLWHDGSDNCGTSPWDEPRREDRWHQFVHAQ